MGWSSGTSLFRAIIREAMIAIPDDKTRKQFYIPIYEEFCDHNWNTDDECLAMDNVFDAIYHEKWGEDNDYDDEEDE